MFKSGSGVCAALLATTAFGQAAQIGAVSPTALYLRAGTIDTTAARPVAELAAMAGQVGHVVVQLDGPMRPEWREQLRDAGVGLGDYLPMNAYIATVRHGDANRIARLDFVRWFAPYDDAWKLDPDVRLPAASGEGDATAIRVLVTLFDDAPANAIDAILAGMNARTFWRVDMAGNETLALEIPAAALDAIATHESVQYVEPAYEITPRNSTTRWIVQSNVLDETPLYDAGLHGENQIVGILDDKVDQNHCSFKDTVPIGPTHRKIVAYNSTPGAGLHGTHVGGIAVGDAGNNSDTRGIAYLGKMTYAPIPNFSETAVVTALNLHHSQGARVHTNSWGNDGTTAYDGLARAFDVFTYDNEDDIVLLAVTNLSTLKNPENAKNLLACGNSEDTPNQGNHCTGGAGPTSDGRRKPEIYAPGCNTQSASAGSSCGVTGLTGTSMATPALAGVAMMVRQYYQEGFYPSGVPDPGSGFTPSGALIKATMLNGTVDMTGVTGFPSNTEGWGRILADNALYFAGDIRTIQTIDVRNSEGLTTGAVDTAAVNVLGSAEPLRITLVFTEPPAAAGATFASINDLDLEVISPTGSLYKGNVFSGGQSVTGGTKDDRNNVEQVHIPNPEPGPWEVRVIGAAVNVGKQGYAVVSTGDLEGAQVGLSIFLSSPPPPLIDPGVPTDINVTIREGMDTLVPGSPTLHYRLTGGAFSDVPLTHMGGDQWVGTLPAASCTDDPEFYVSAEGVTSGVKNSPPSAPASTYTMTVGELQTTQIAEYDFESGLPAGWTTSGLWHVTGACAVLPTCNGTQWAYYGIDGQCNYDNGSTNSGSMTTSVLSIPAVPPGGNVTMRYCSNLETEQLSPYDAAEVRINGTVVDTPAETNSWEEREVDLTPYAGQNVSIEFFFDTVDAVFNEFRGWQVDHVRLEVTSLVCEDCYADCDSSGTLDLFDFLCFTNAFNNGSPYADCDKNQTLDLFDFLCFTNAFNTGCP